MSAREMTFTVKDLGVSTGGILIVVVNWKDANHIDVHPLDRILVRFGRKKTVAVVDVDLHGKNVKPGRLGVFEEIQSKLGLEEGDTVMLDYAKKPSSIGFIKKKLDGGVLKAEETYTIVHDIVHDELTDEELSYYVSGCYTRGMTMQEAIDLTRATVDTGDRIRPKDGQVFLDKHCIGGIPNNRTTMVVVPILIAAGLKVPKTSSRSITSPAGTADTMEVLAPVTLPLAKMEKMVKEIGGFITWGGAVSLAAADDKLIKVRHTLSLDPEGMLLASIMAKKAAVGATHVLIDIPLGKDSKVTTKKQAIHLDRQFHKIGKKLGMAVKVMISRGEEPIGNGIGPALEARDVLWILMQDQRRPMDLEQKSVRMAGILMEMAGIRDGQRRSGEILASGAAYQAMKRIIKAQGGDPAVRPERIHIGEHSKLIRSQKSGRVIDINTDLISHVARIAGAPVDKAAGIYMHVHEGFAVKKGDPLLTIYSESDKKLKFALDEYYKGKVVVVW